MDHLDLNLDNYSLEDLLNLFKISWNFDEADLKNVKLWFLKHILTSQN